MRNSRAEISEGVFRGSGAALVCGCGWAEQSSGNAKIASRQDGITRDRCNDAP
jgi:hypothetical protein